MHLPWIIWRPLYCTFKFALSPDKEVERIFLNSRPVNIESTYSTGLLRSLNAVLQIDDKTRSISIELKSSENLNLDLWLKDNRLMINQKWADFGSSHEHLHCQVSKSGVEKDNTRSFQCEHVVEFLYDLLLAQLPDKFDALINACRRNHVRDKLREMPRQVWISRGEGPSEILVSWVGFKADDSLNGYVSNEAWQVTLHRESTCSNKKTELVRSGKRVSLLGC